MTSTEPFALPPTDADRETWLDAIARLNAVTITIDQLERGYEVYSRQASLAFEFKPHETPLDVLRAFCEREGLLPADVAAEAILIRVEPIEEAACGGVDLKVENPEAFAACATDPITPYDLGLDENQVEMIPVHS